MARERKMSLAEAKAYASFAGVRLDFTEIAAEINRGEQLRLIQSSFRDSGPDWTEMRLGARVLARVEGY